MTANVKSDPAAITTQGPQSLSANGVARPTADSAGLSKFCFACGNAIDPRAEICPGCGVRQQAAAIAAGKDRAAAAAFAILLGSFGAHKFYLGRPAMGVLYLVFFWTYIPGIIGWIEGMRYLLSDDASWAERYGGPPREASKAAVTTLWIIAVAPVALLLLAVVLIFFGGQVQPR